MTYAEWIASFGVTGDDALPEADLSGNGVANLLEYATGGHPGRTGFKPGDYGASVEKDDAESDARLTLRFVRDERATDLLYEVQVSENLRDWETIAESAAGAPVTSEHEIRIEETSARPVSSIGVLRQVSVSDTVPLPAAAKRFLRLKVSLLNDE